MTLAALGWADWLAISALAISAVSLALAISAERRAGRAEQRAGRAERRDEQRIEREREQAEAANRARLVILPNGSGATVDDRRFAYVIRNHGKATAYDVRVYLQDEERQDVSIKPQAGFDLAPDESVDDRGVSAPLDVQPEDVRFGICWWDGAGFNRWETNMPPTL